MDHLHSRESLDSSVSQPGDMCSVDVVDGAENGAGVVSVSMSVPVSPVELSTRLSDNAASPVSLTNETDHSSEHPRSNEDANDDERCSQEPRTNVSARERADAPHDYPHQERAEIYQNTLQAVASPVPVADTSQSELTGAAMTLCCGTTAAQQQEAETVKKQPDIIRRQQETKQPKPSEGCLLRLFESQIFDMSMAISYLFNSKEPGVQSYLGR